MINGCNRLILVITYTFQNYFKRAWVRGMDGVREDTFIAAVLWAFQSLKWSFINAICLPEQTRRIPQGQHKAQCRLKNNEQVRCDHLT